MCLIDAIPLTWKKILKNQVRRDEQIGEINNNILTVKIGNKLISVGKLEMQDIYFAILDNKNVEPSCIKAWSERLYLDLSDSEWSDIFILPKFSVKDIRIREFQYKIIHRFYACDSKVAKWDVTVKSNCKFCNNGIANILHTFYECRLALDFWQRADN